MRQSLQSPQQSKPLVNGHHHQYHVMITVIIINDRGEGTSCYDAHGWTTSPLSVFLWTGSQ